MKKITPHFWFDQEAKAAAAFYTSIFPDSKITQSSVIRDTPSGDCDIVSFELGGQPFLALSAGPLFRPNPSISFFVNFDPSRDGDAKVHLDALWDQLSEGGKILMSLQEYPFSKHYGWVEDRFGVSWQLILTHPAGEERPFIVPSLLFTGEQWGKAEEATDFYLSVFSPSRRGQMVKYPEGMEPHKPGTVMFTDFELSGGWFAAMDSVPVHDFRFSEGISLVIPCETQAEIDYYWEKLSAVSEAEQCGWLKDAYGVSWQVVPTQMDEMMEHGSPEQMARVTQAFLKMKKFDVETLQKAYQGTGEASL